MHYLLALLIRHNAVHVHDSAWHPILELLALVSESSCNTASASPFLAQALVLRGLPAAYHRNLTDLCSCHRQARHWTGCSRHHPAPWIWVGPHLAHPRLSDVVSCGPPKLALFARAFHHAAFLSRVFLCAVFRDSSLWSSSRSRRILENLESAHPPPCWLHLCRRLLQCSTLLLVLHHLHAALLESVSTVHPRTFPDKPLWALFFA